VDIDEAESLMLQAVEEAVRLWLARIDTSVFADPANPDMTVFPAWLWPVLVQDVIIPAVRSVFEQAAVGVAAAYGVLIAERLLSATFINDISTVVNAQTIPQRVEEDVTTAAASGGGSVAVLAALVAAWAPMIGVMAFNAAAVAVAAGEFVAASAVAASRGSVVVKRWIAHDDERTRISHANVDNTTVAVDDVFIVGGFPLRFPHDPYGPVQEVVNCRCRLSYGVRNG